MTDDSDEQGILLPDEQRLTRFGSMLRLTSFDELPELLNILKGDMSFIGPRPLLVKYLPRYNETQRRRHEVRPGMTGMAQVNGRNSISWDEKFSYDVFYVDNYSFITDVQIFLKSIKVVLTRADINSASSVSMEEFLGSE
jgi:lipopolysaccharide/colanic/teichoic acid biosynthesis glycosyltransferase